MGMRMGAWVGCVMGGERDDRGGGVDYWWDASCRTLKRNDNNDKCRKIPAILMGLRLEEGKKLLEDKQHVTNYRPSMLLLYCTSFPRAETLPIGLASLPIARNHKQHRERERERTIER